MGSKGPTACNTSIRTVASERRDLPHTDALRQSCRRPTAAAPLPAGGGLDGRRARPDGGDGGPPPPPTPVAPVGDRRHRPGRGPWGLRPPRLWHRALVGAAGQDLD